MGVGKKLTMFCAGGAAYVCLELLWRGRSHSSMFLAGGSCFMLLGRLGRCIKDPILRCIGSAAVITLVELIVGLLFNRRYKVWDYRAVPLNFKGQICLPYFLLWMPVGQLGIWIYKKFDSFLQLFTQKPLDKQGFLLV